MRKQRTETLKGLLQVDITLASLRHIKGSNDHGRFGPMAL